MGSGTCCDSMKYKVVLSGNFSKGYGDDARLAIRAVGNNDGILPFFAFTAPIPDSTAGQVIKFVGNFTLKMSPAHASALTKDPQAKEAFSKAVGVTPDEVIITAIYLNDQKVAMRRLKESGSGSAVSNVKVEYTVITSNMDKTITNINVDTLKTNVQDEAKVIGQTILVKSVTAPNPAATTQGTPLQMAAPTLVFHMVAVFIATCMHILL